MPYNYSKLLGRIKEKGYTQESLAAKVGMRSGTLSQKLNNKAKFKQTEITDICKLLRIDDCEIGDYFFAH